MQASKLEQPAAAPRRALNGQDYKTLALAALGGALEFYDFIIFVFFAPVIGQLFFPAAIPDWLRQLQTFGIFAAGYLARPLGGIVMAHFGDLLGRKRMFTLSVFLMALPTLAMGLLPAFAQIGAAAPALLLVLRVLQGAAVGGEVPGAWVFVSEHVPARQVGFACGTLTSGLTAGILLGSLIASLVHHLYSGTEIAAYAWRLPFLIGGVFGLVAVYLRRWLHETPVFAELQRRKSLSAEVPLKSVVRDHRGAVAVSMLLTCVLAAAVVVVILMTPSLLQKQFGLAPAQTLSANIAATLMLSLGCVLAGALAGRFGVKPVLALGFLLLAASYYALFDTVAVHPALLVPVYAGAGFVVGVIGAIPLVMVRAFPPEVRFSGISFSYNVAYAVFGGLTPIAVSLWMKNDAQAPVLFVALVCVAGSLTACLMRVPARGASRAALASA
jgi:MFS family permease